MAANPVVPFGFRPVYLGGSSPPNYAIAQRSIAYNNSNKIAFNDPVIGLSTGYIDVYTIATNHILGVMVGPVVYANPTAVGGVNFGQYWSAPSGLASTTVVQAGLITDPTMIFMAQYVGAALDVGVIGDNVDITTSTSGAPNAAGISVCSLGGTATGTTNTLPFRIRGIVGISDALLGAGSGGTGPIPNYNPLNDNQFLYVSMNTSELLNTTGV